jgi:hypothetical protein
VWSIVESEQARHSTDSLAKQWSRLFRRKDVVTIGERTEGTAGVAPHEHSRDCSSEPLLLNGVASDLGQLDEKYVVAHSTGDPSLLTPRSPVPSTSTLNNSVPELSLVDHRLRAESNKSPTIAEELEMNIVPPTASPSRNQPEADLVHPS